MPNFIPQLNSGFKDNFDHLLKDRRIILYAVRLSFTCIQVTIVTTGRIRRIPILHNKYIVSGLKESLLTQIILMY